MKKKVVCALTFLVILTGLNRGLQAYEFTDDFNTPRDYLVENVHGSGWDGFVGLGSNETVDVLQADINHPNKLYIQSAGATWESGWSPLGPFLYREVRGDFVATVRITDFAGAAGEPLLYNDCFLMARVGEAGAAGAGEDFICIHYFPTLVGNMGRDVNNGEENEWGLTSDGFDCATYIQLERSGNIFYFRISHDGSNWDSLNTSDSPFNVDGESIERTDFDGVCLQVGVAHATYSVNTGYVAFDDFSLIYDVANPYARGPSPPNEAEYIDVYAALQWVAGDLVQDTDGHEVYLGTNFADVNGSETADFIISDPCKAPGTLAFGAEYFWRVDEVNGSIWRGPVWNFTADTGKGRNPEPGDGAMGVPPSMEKLRWTPSPYAVSQDVYFGTAGLILAGSGLAGDVGECNIPAGYLPLQTYTNYYWQVDTDNGALPATTGDIWHFETEAIVFEDDFDTPHNFLTKGPGKWDGFIGQGVNETVSKLEADIDANYPNQLFIESAGGYWDSPWEPLGPLLYKEVCGDFIATVKVTDYPGLYEPNHSGAVYNNNCGIMARASDPGAGGEGEDWVSIDYQPLFFCGNYFRYADNDIQYELCNNGLGWGGGLWLRLERSGNNFHGKYSFNGEDWQELGCSPLSRPDLEGVTLQVGLMQATYTSNSGYAAFDDFRLVHKPWPSARGPRPARNATDVPICTELVWRAGDSVASTNGHDVYLGTNETAVADANRSNYASIGVDYYNVSDPCCEAELFKLTTDYFWRVDEVNGAKLWEGEVWKFTTSDWIVLDDFDSYSTRSELRARWKDGYSFYPTTKSGSNITLSSLIDSRYGHEPPGPSRDGTNALQLVYNNSGWVCIYIPDRNEWCYSATYYSEMEATTASLQGISDWTLEGIKAISIWFYGDPCNDAGATEQMYIALEDDDSDAAIVKYGDSAGEDVNNLKNSEWSEWAIELQEFRDANSNFDLTNVKKVYIGFGDRDNHPNPGGSGIVYFESIRLYRPRCIGELAVGDLTGNCVIDFGDFVKLAEGWHGGPASADINGDNEVDFKDLTIMTDKWLQELLWP